MKQFYVYIFIDPRNDEAFYVGKGFGWRWKRHLTLRGPNKHLRNRIRAIRNAGLEPKLERCFAIDEEDAFRMEKDLIKTFGRRDQGTGTLCNYTDGGEGSTGRTGFTHSPESKAKISNSQKGKIISEETRKKLSVAKKGKPQNHSMETHAKRKATLNTPEFRKYLSERAKRTVTPEHLAEMTEKARIKNIGIKRSDDHRKKISEAQKGRKFSDETRLKMSIAQYLRQAREHGEYVGD